MANSGVRHRQPMTTRMACGAAVTRAGWQGSNHYIAQWLGTRAPASTPCPRCRRRPRARAVPCASGYRTPRIDVRRTWPDPRRGYPFRLGQHERDKDRSALGISLGQAPSDRGSQRPPGPGCLIPCRPVSARLAARRHAPLLLLHVLLQRPARKRPSPLGKGPDLRKLVAGAGFEPATSGL